MQPIIRFIMIYYDLLWFIMIYYDLLNYDLLVTSTIDERVQCPRVPHKKRR
jgi:hypothetical protein